MIPTFWLLLSVTLLHDEPVGRTRETGAFDIKSGRFLYREVRNESFRAGRPLLWRFDYFDEDGKAIVTRTVDFGTDAIRPAFELTDLRNNYKEGARVTSDGIRVYTGGSADDPFAEATLQVPEPAVIDAGFNYFVEEQFDRLLRGETIKFNFVAPSQLDYFGFRMYQTGEEHGARHPTVSITMDIDNFLLRLFVDPIRLTYDRRTKQLLRYEGISNIYGDSGKSYKVRMEFELTP